jgi:hypothetical protein
MNEIRKIKLLILGLLILAVLIGALATWFVVNEVQKCDCMIKTKRISQEREYFNDGHGMMWYEYDLYITDISFYISKYDVISGIQE